MELSIAGHVKGNPPSRLDQGFADIDVQKHFKGFLSRFLIFILGFVLSIGMSTLQLCTFLRRIFSIFMVSDPIQIYAYNTYSISN